MLKKKTGFRQKMKQVVCSEILHLKEKKQKPVDDYTIIGRTLLLVEVSDVRLFVQRE